MSKQVANPDQQGIPPADADRYKISSFDTFNRRWAGSYDRHLLTRYVTAPWDRQVIEVLKNQPVGGRHLDAGCAGGRLLSRLSQFPDLSLSGVDLCPAMIRTARMRLEQAGAEADLKAADLEGTLPWESGWFDSVSMCGVLHHLNQPETALKELGRLLRPGGLLLIADPWFPAVIRLPINLFLRITPVNGDCRFYSPAGAVRLVTGAGMHFSELRRIGWHSMFIVLRNQAS